MLVWTVRRQHKYERKKLYQVARANDRKCFLLSMQTFVSILNANSDVTTPRERWYSRCREKGLYTSLTRADTTEGKPSIISAVNEMCQRWRMYVTRGVRLADAADYPAREKNPGKVEERRRQSEN